MEKPFHSELSVYIGQNDIDGANAVIMKEMGKIAVHHRADFIDLLVNSDAPAHADFADEQLINMYFDNIHKKEMLIGTALLVNMHNKSVGFDGEREINDDATKASYRVMSNFFGGITGIPNSAGYKKAHEYDWKHSDLFGLGAVKAGVGVAKNIKARNDMKKAAEAERIRIAEAKAKKLKTGLIIGGTVVGLVVIGLLIYKFKK